MSLNLAMCFISVEISGTHILVNLYIQIQMRRAINARLSAFNG